MRKGVTPVVATVLLITVTMAATGTIYTVFQDKMKSAESSTSVDLPLNMDALQVDHCYHQYGNTHLIVRNSASSAMNASEMTLLLNGSQQDSSTYTIKPSIVDSTETFTVNITKKFEDETLIQMTDGEHTLKYSCFNF
ncbi:MAG: archaellin/type IV pilin N-terminal domain-containing protein [Candidatus Nanohalobium sp.]